MLERLGFRAVEIHQCEAYCDGRVVVPATIAGEPARLLLDSAQRLDLTITRSYARRREFPYERSSVSWGKSPLADFECLGRTRPHQIVVVMGREEDRREYDTIGGIGAEFLDGAIVAIDPMEWQVGLSVRGEMRGIFSLGRHRVPLLPDVLSNLPVTSALTDGRREGVHPMFIVDTSRTHSCLSLRYAQRHWSRAAVRAARRVCRARSEKLETAWRLPDGTTVRLNMHVVERCEPGYIESLPGGGVDGYLGLDFLLQWLPVLDLAGRELVLFDLRECFGPPGGESKSGPPGPV